MVTTRSTEREDESIPPHNGEGISLQYRGHRDQRDQHEQREDSTPDNDPLPPAETVAQRRIRLMNLDPQELAAMVAVEEAKAEQARNVERLLYLMGGGIGTEQQQVAEQERINLPQGPYDSQGNHKRFASEELDSFSKAFKPASPDTFDGSSYDDLERFLMEAELYFEAVNANLDSEEAGQVKRYIRTAGTWLRGDAQKAYTRDRSSIETWDGFKTFLRGTIRDPLTRMAEATRRSQYLRQRGDQTARQFLHDIEQAEKEVEALQLDEEQQKAMRFLHGLHADLKNAIMAESSEILTSRTKILAAAGRHEQRLGTGKKKEFEQKDRGRSNHPSYNNAKNRSFSHTNRTGSPHGNGGRSANAKNETQTKEKVQYQKSTFQAKSSSNYPCRRCGQAWSHGHQCKPKGHDDPKK
ncbi:hypothetical protein H2198_007755 [Neophaeococcomyces mojaviensis]|uniref:Uncharacterized protein n=1 Tax=Neophaeococcomyces mojaviensis TaxID=3383035 RepID=A0ACC2ZZ43_9EURO|nr:hypothetical protein H2198_007755 [Knufia sp. JES_112]